MVFEFKFPDVGEGITEGKLVEWKVSPGDAVEEDQTVANVETDKAVVEIPAPQKGVVKELLFEPGDTLHVGKTMMTIKSEGSTDESFDKKDEKSVEPQKENVSEKNEDVEARKPVNNSKQILAMPSVRHLAKERGIDLSKIQGSGKDGRITKENVEGLSVEGQKQDEVLSKTKNVARTSIDIKASPSIRQFAREQDIDISQVQGSGDNGRILKSDVEKAASKESTKTSDIEEKIAEKVSFSSIRKAIADKMVEATHKAALVTHTDEVDLTELVEIRNKEDESFKDIHITFMPFFFKAVVLALKQYPNFNAVLDEESKEIIRKQDYHIGFAADTERGLLVPVVKNTDSKSIVELSKEIHDLAKNARDGKISSPDLSGSTFTISNVGSLGGEVFTPIPNYPEVAILGIGTIKDKPGVVEGEIKIRKKAVFSLTFDHRVVDGADAARFLSFIIKRLEDPNLLFMEMS